jgi:hypothetical protein
MTDYTEDVLRRLQDLLVLIPAESGPQTALLTHDDQLFIFETAGLLITSGNFDAEVIEEKISVLFIFIHCINIKMCFHADKEKLDAQSCFAGP